MKEKKQASVMTYKFITDEKGRIIDMETGEEPVANEEVDLKIVKLVRKPKEENK